MAVLVTGGARSGKSFFAEKLAMHRSQRGIYIATSHIYDEEMRERIELHQQMRLALRVFHGIPGRSRSAAGIISTSLHESGEDAVVLVDCLTLWLSNWLLHYEGESDASARVTSTLTSLWKQCPPTVDNSSWLRMK